MSRNPNRSLWSRIFGAGTASAKTQAKRLALEALEDRAVPATVVTNLFDSTNVSSPIAGSLRDAITRPDASGKIVFDSKLFSDAVGPQTLILNGAVGRLQINNGSNLTIEGPGKFSSGPYAGQYKLIIQSDLGILNATVTNGGKGFKPGDILQQGFDEYSGGARFQVLSTQNGAITAVTVVQPGANASFRATGVVLGPNGSGITRLTPVGGSTGSGAFLQVNPTDVGTATGLVQQQMTGASGIITVSGVHFGTGRGNNVIVNLGAMTVNDCLFDNADKFGFPKQSLSYISVSSGGGNLTISNSSFVDSGASTVFVDGRANSNLTITGSVFSGNDESAVTYNSSRAVTITDSTFDGNGDGGGTGTAQNPAIGKGAVFIDRASTVAVTNTLFINNKFQNYDYDLSNEGQAGASALALNSVGVATVNNCTFDNNISDKAGFQIPGEPDFRVYQRGGAAILAYGTASLSVSKSIFRGNQVIGIDQEDSGGGAIYNLNGNLSLVQCGFEDNSISITGYPRSTVAPDTTDYQTNPELQPSARYSGGGAVYSGGSTTITGSYFSGNSVFSQVDFWEHAVDETATPSKPLYSGGGALYLTSNGVTATNFIANTTLTGNSAEQTGVTTDLTAAGRNGTVFLPLGATPSAVITMPGTGGFGAVGDSIVTLNASGPSYSTAAPSFAKFTAGYTVDPPVTLGATPASNTGAIERGDFDNDGIFDFAIANPQVNTLTVYSGSATGTYSLSKTLTTGKTLGAAPIAVAVGDFNNDGFDDLAAANAGENNISVFLGDGLGGFGPQSFIQLSGTPVALTAGDFNNDGFDDLTAVSTTGTISQMNWDGTTSAFSAPVNSFFSNSPASIKLGDVNGDGILDAVTALPSSNQVNLFLGQASGTYALSQVINTDDPNSRFNPKTNTQPRIARLADLDGDGLPDLYAALYGTSDIMVLGNTGGTKGSFFPAIRTANDYYGVVKSPVDVVATSSTKFTLPNLVVASDSSNMASILINNSNLGSPSFVRRNLPSGKGLNGGAMIIADGRAINVPNNVASNAYNGTSTTSIVNCTITGNSLVNPFATNSNSNVSTARAQSTGNDQWVNATDTGGVFADTASGSSILTTNTMMNNNIGIRYIQQVPGSSNLFTYGEPVLGNTSTGTRNLAQGTVLFNSLSNSMYDPTACYGYNNTGGVGYQSITPRIGDITQSDNTANLDPSGLQTDVRAPQIGLLSNPAYSGRIKYIPIERLSPARDSGTSVNVYPNPLSTDVRGANRLINVNVDIGAFEVQYATSTTVASPILAPADSTHPNPYTFTTFGQQVTLTAKSQWNDNKLPTEGIQGIVELVRASDNAVLASGTLVQVQGDTKAGTVTFAINNNSTNLLATGANTLYLRYSGDMNYATSQSTRFDIIVNPAATTTSLVAPVPSPAGRYDPILFAGTVSAPASTQIPIGTVDLGYQVGSGPFVVFATNTPVASDGSFSASLIPANVGLAYGAYNIVAKFNPTDFNQFSVSTSMAQALTIGVSPTVTLSSISPNPVQAADSVTFSAIVLQTDPMEPLSGSLDFIANGVSLGNVPFANATPLPGGGGLQYSLTTTNTNNLNLGTQSVTARYNQDGGSYATTTSSGQNITVLGYNSTTTASASSLSVPYGTPVNLSATVSHVATPILGNGTVTFFKGSSVLGTGAVNEANPTATLPNLILSGGTYLIDAAFSGDGTTYNPSTSNPVSIQVTPANAAAVLAASTVVSLGSSTTFTTTLTPSVSGTGITGLTGRVVYSVSINGATPTVIGSVPVTLGGVNTYRASLNYTAPVTGNYTVSAAYTGDSNFSSTIAPLDFRVNRVVIQRFYAIAPAVGSTIQLFSTATNTQMTVIRPLGAAYTGGFRVCTTGDVTGDGIADLVYTARTTSFVRIVDGRTLNPLGGFYAYSTNYPNPVNIATGDVNGDLRDDIIVAPGGTGFAPVVKVFNAASLSQVLWSKTVYASNYLGGVTVASADVDNDGRADIITGPMTSSAANVRVFSGANGALLKSFVVSALGTGYTGGIWVAANVYASGAVDIVTSANSGAPRVVATDYSTLATRANFLAFPATYRGSIRVAMADTNGDGVKELLVGIGANGGGPLVARYTQNYQRIDQFFAFGPANGAASFNGGVFPG